MPHHFLIAEEPDWDSDMELPPDPFPEWYLFTAGHTFAAADTDGWA